MRILVSICLSVFSLTLKAQCTLGSFSITGASSTNSSISISWSASAGADGYNILKRVGSGSYSGAGSSTGTSKTISGLSPGTTYEFKVIAFCEYQVFDPDIGETITNINTRESSNTRTATTKPNTPTVRSAVNITSTSFTARWNAATGASQGYELDVSTSPAFSSYVPGYQDKQVSGTSHSVVGLSSGTSYYYRVRAKGAGGTSGNSNTQSAETLAAIPTISSPSEMTQTSFQANWETAEGAEDYLLYVSTTSNFTSHISGYNGKAINATSELITNLTAGTSYYYRVQSANNGGILSGYSASEVALLIPAEVLTTSLAISQTGFMIHWEDVLGADRYILRVSSEEDFSTSLSGYPKTLTDTSEILSGLTPGETYYYQVQSENSSGLSSAEINAITLVPGEPSELSVFQSGDTELEIIWQNTTGADSYIIDVAMDEAFGAPLNGYDKKEIASNTEVITGLDPGTPYFIRIKAGNISGQSGYSEVLEALTIPFAPENLETTSYEANQFTLIWDEVSGIVDHYEILVAKDNTQFMDVVSGFDPREVSAPRSQIIVNGLEPNRVYEVKIRAVNSSGNSEYSTVVSGGTTSAGGEILRPEISNVSMASDVLNFEVSEGLAQIERVEFFHKKISDTEFTGPTLLTRINQTFQVSIDDSWKDIFGWEYKVIATDKINETATVQDVVVNDPGEQIVPLGSFGTAPKNYSIISIPYDLAEARISTVLLPLMQGYDRSRWRFVQYKNGKNVDYNEGLSVQSFKRGESYWFISSEEIALNLGAGEINMETVGDPFTLVLNAGYNQISTPFPFPISWSDVLDHNGNPSGVSSDLLIYDNENISFAIGDQLIPYSGGFVFAEDVIALEIPLSFINSSGTNGRVSDRSVNIETSWLWQLPITIEQGKIRNELAMVGMHKDASETLDRFDLVTPPPFASYAYLHTDHTHYKLSRDIVNAQASFTWNYTLSNSEHGIIKLSWPIVELPDEASLILYDPQNHHALDMTQSNHYHFNGGSRNIIIHYTNQAQAFIEQINTTPFGLPYPNPTDGYVEIPIAVSFEQGEQTKGQLSIYDHTGKLIYDTRFTTENSGVQNVQWNGRNASGHPVNSGLYFYKLKMNRNDQVTTSTGKIIIQK